MTIEEAIMLATTKHAGQTDKEGKPYILHPLRIMLKQKDRASRIVAIFHDLIEDTDVTFQDLCKFGLSKEIITALRYLTKKKNEPYDAFITRVAENPLASRIKLDDINDNGDPLRMELLPKKERARLTKKYRDARKLLLKLRPELKNNVKF